jgi:DAK2 domain fusion protein YloV
LTTVATSDLETVRRLAGAAAAALDANRERIDDLNVYPVPDGDTGTNMTLTVRAILEALDESEAPDRRTLAREVTRAALMGARGNSGVILSQIVRGLAEVVGDEPEIDAPTLARALRAASDAAYRGVRRPVEGTMLTVVRELAEEADSVARPGLAVEDLLRALVRRGEEALAHTPQLLEILRQAGVVDAGGAGLLELLRGFAAGVSGEPLPEPGEREAFAPEAIHQELSRYRYCTVFVVEGKGLDPTSLEGMLDPLGDSLLVVGDESAVKVHLHTDDPGAALTVGSNAGILEAVEIANMHQQSAAREERLLHPVPPAETITDVVAVVVGDGNRRLYESLGVTSMVEGGQSMNPSTAEIVAALTHTSASQAIVLPNNSNVIMAAEQAAALTEKPVLVVPTRSLQEGLAAMVAFEPSRSAEENAEEMAQATGGVATGAVTTASRDVEIDGRPIREGNYIGLIDGEPVVGGNGFETVTTAVLDRLLDDDREVLTLLTGADAPPLDGVLRAIEERYPELELEVHAGGQPHYFILISAE